MSRPGRVVGVDPGRSKAGYAILEADGTVVTAGIEPIERLADSLRLVLAGSRIDSIALGRGTNARSVRNSLEPLGIPIALVDEFETTRVARELYFTENPPRGWRRLVPRGLLLPGRPIDDYAAVLIGRRFLAREAAARPPS